MYLMALYSLTMMAVTRILLKYHGIVGMPVLILLLAMVVGRHGIQSTGVALLLHKQEVQVTGIQLAGDAGKEGVLWANVQPGRI